MDRRIALFRVDRTMAVPSHLRVGARVGGLFAPLLLLFGCQAQPRPISASASAPVELHVITSGGFAAAFASLGKQYSAETGARIVTTYGASMGDTPNAIPARLSRAEPADVVILARPALDRLAAEGMVVASTKVDLGLSRIALAVKKGVPLPDISTPAAFRATLIHAKSIGWSDSASGVYIRSTLLKKLGVADEISAKGRTIAGEPVGNVVARGDVEIGMQQLSELRAVKGIRIVGLLPESLQQITPFSGGVVSYSKQPAAARSLLAYLSSTRANAAIRASGLAPAPRKPVP